jgi:hypothetical protein
LEVLNMAEFASKGVAGAGLGLGIAGTALGLLNDGTVGNLLGGRNGWNNGCGYGGMYNGCSENSLVNRYEAGQSARIAELETEVKLRDANFYTLSEMGKLRDYVDNRFSAVEKEICEQKVFNATSIATISCIQGQVAQLMGLTKLVVPNGSVCPGWGDVTVTVTPTTTGA